MVATCFSAWAEGPVVLNEIMAKNTAVLADEDHDYPDWIELYNPTTAAVNLEGWQLSNSAKNGSRWTFPATNIAARGYLVVFASGKNRAVAGCPLHTDFQLGAQGEYLALFQPDGVTLADELAPAYPEQYENISYGRGLRVATTQLITNGATARYLIPDAGSLGMNWTQRVFDDSTWESGPTGLGFAADTNATASGLYAYWPIREGAGSVASNLVAGGADGILHGAVWVTNDMERGTVLSLDGVSSYVSAGTIPRMGRATSNFTWSCWYRQRSAANLSAVILGNRAGGVTDASGTLQFIKLTPRKFNYYHDGDVGSLNHTIVSGAWLHLAVVKAGPALRYYENGVLVASSMALDDIETNPFYWGGDPNYSGEYSNGLIDDISLWTTALEADAMGRLAAGLSPAALNGLGGFVTTDLGGRMRGVNASAYIRIPFTVAEGAVFSAQKLKIQYDDGFVAYLNGAEVARRNAPADASWNAAATAGQSILQASQNEEIDLSAWAAVLAPGTNVLAIQGLNLSADDPDFLILPTLEATGETDLGWRYFPAPTAGAANGEGYLGIVAGVQFDRERGFYEAPFTVMLTCPTSDATIRYTTNGAAPSAESGLVYEAPISIQGTTILRAGAYKTGHLSPPVKTQSYLFLEQVLTQTGSGFPTSWGRDWQMDPRVVTNAAYADRIRAGMKSLPIVSLALDPLEFWGPSGIYTLATRKGRDYERAGSAEMFFADGSKAGFQINCGIQIVGAASRSMTPKHGLGLTFKSSYGPTKLAYAFFDDSAVNEFDFLSFRPNFNMSWVRTDNSGPLNNSNADGAERIHAIYVRDQFTKESQLAMGQWSAHERFVHLYIDGLYWGLYNPSERTDASFAAAYGGGNKADYDAIFSDPSTVARAKDGDKTAWTTMMNLANQGLADAEAYARIQPYLDVTNLADYMMLNFYCATVDWPWQNWNAARKREPGAPFRFFAWDAEYTLETPPWVPADRTGVGAAGDEADSPARLYHQLRRNAEWCLLFADRAHRHFFNDGALTTNQASARFIRLCDTIDSAIVGESARWGDVVRTSKPYTRDAEWLTEKNRLLRDFFPQRTDLVIQQFKAAGLYPQVDAPETSASAGTYTNALSLTLNGPGTIYYTTNGTDPRLPGGAIAPGARVYTGAIVLASSAQVMARGWLNNTWSALSAGQFTVTASAPSLTARVSGSEVVISWPAEAPGYVLETTDTLAPPQWNVVSGVVANPVTVSPVGNLRFYRLRKSTQ